MGIFAAVKSLFSRENGKTKSSTYQSASQGRRLTNWQGTDASMNNILFSDLATIRRRSRDMVRQNPYASNAVDTIVSNTIGCGITPLIRNDDKKFEGQIKEAFEVWKNECDPSMSCDFFGMQALACREMVESGEIFIRFRDRLPSDKLYVPLQLQLIEPEQLDNSRTVLQGSVKIANGIEYDEIGRIVAYHFLRDHPGDLFSTSALSVRVPSDRVVHIFKPLRAGQNRGLPWLSNILVKLHELDQYDDAELVRKKIAAMFTAFITTDDNTEDTSVLPNQTVDEDEPSVYSASLEPGTTQYLNPGEDIKFSQPADLGDSYKEFMGVQLRGVAAGLGLLYEQVSGDLRNVNYSSIRAGMLEFRKKVETTQKNIFVFQMCRPVYREFVKKAILSGAVDMPKDFLENQHKYTSCSWVTPGWEWVDPLKDVQASIKEIRAGLTSRSKVVASRGVDIEELDRELKNERDREESLGLVLESDASNGKETKGVQKETEDEDERTAAPVK
jgi:lambda family phage portal protein